MPVSVVKVAQSQRDAGSSPTVRSVPGPRKRIESNRLRVIASARRVSAAVCSCHAATGSGSSSRVAVATTCHRRSTSGTPNTSVAHPSFGAEAIGPVQPAVGHQRQPGPADLALIGPRHELRVEVVEQVRLGRAAELDHRWTLFGPAADPLDLSGRGPAQLGSRAELDCCTSKMEVRVADLAPAVLPL